MRLSDICDNMSASFIRVHIKADTTFTVRLKADTTSVSDYFSFQLSSKIPAVFTTPAVVSTA